MNVRLMDWGSSMYGGYYASIIVSEENYDNIVGLHQKKLKDLKKELETYGLNKLESYKRRDN